MPLLCLRMKCYQCTEVTVAALCDINYIYETNVYKTNTFRRQRNLTGNMARIAIWHYSWQDKIPWTERENNMRLVFLVYCVISLFSHYLFFILFFVFLSHLTLWSGHLSATSPARSQQALLWQLTPSGCRVAWLLPPSLRHMSSRPSLSPHNTAWPSLSAWRPPWGPTYCLPSLHFSALADDPVHPLHFIFLLLLLAFLEMSPPAGLFFAFIWCLLLTISYACTCTYTQGPIKKVMLP